MEITLSPINLLFNYLNKPKASLNKDHKTLKSIEQLLNTEKPTKEEQNFVRNFPNKSLSGKIAVHRNYPISNEDLKTATANITSPFAVGIRLNPNCPANFKRCLDLELHFYNQQNDLNYSDGKSPGISWYELINKYQL